jgi:RimJ/RimL family protein N-acetyltransferase
MIKLRPITAEDAAEVKKWPPYTEGFEMMDYALRDDGWLDEYGKRQLTWIYKAELNGQAVGFSLLSTTAEGEAELRIAVHPRRIGRGLGRAIAVATIREGFHRMNLTRIHLIVRKENPVALKLYEKLGFMKSGESTRTIQGKIVEFITMHMSRENFDKHYLPKYRQTCRNIGK